MTHQYFIKTLLVTLNLLSSLLLLSPILCAEEITLQHQGITLNANLQKTDNWTNGPVILLTHGTLAHNKMELISTLQNLFEEQNISTLAINLSLGINNRHGFYDCATLHTHKHTDAIKEIDVWVNWLKQKNINNVILLGHSRGGNQTAWYAAEHNSALVSKIILIAPATWSREHSISDYKKRYGKELMPLLNKAQSLVKSEKGDTQLHNINFIYCKNTNVTAESFVSYYDNNKNKDTPYLIPEIKKPLLIIAGSEDTTVKYLDKLIPPLAEKYHFTFNLIEGSDHFFRDLYADELVESVMEFISE